MSTEMLLRIQQRSLAGWLIGSGTFLIASLIFLLGCQSNPVAIAKTPLQSAYAVYGGFVIVEEQAAQLKKSGALASQPVILDEIIAADRLAKPSADALLQATLDALAAQHALSAGNGSPEKMQIATDNLTHWVTQAQIDILALTSAVQGAKP